MSGGITGLLGLARDGIMAQSYALSVTGQNVANVNTPGYVRREALLATRAAGNYTYGGLEPIGIRRILDPYVESRHFANLGNTAQAKERDSALGTIEALFNDMAGTGLADSLNGFFSSISAVAANPSDLTARSVVLQKAELFASRLRDSAGSVNDFRRDLFNKAKDVTSLEINQLSSQVAGLNSKIQIAEGSGGDASDLKDQQRSILEQLSSRVDIHTFLDTSGGLVVSAAGMTLVEGNIATQLSVDLATDGSMRVMATRAGSTPKDITANLKGGVLGGIKEARDNDAVYVTTKLDALASEVATAVNAQHRLGFGLDGQTNRSIFSVSGPPGSASTITVSADVLGHPERIAASATATGLPGESDNAIALSKISTTIVCSTGTRTPSEAYSDLIGGVGTRKASAQKDLDIRQAMQDQVSSMRSSLTGVSIDEEMVSLTKYQRAYEAATKLLRTADELLADLVKGF